MTSGRLDQVLIRRADLVKYWPANDRDRVAEGVQMVRDGSARSANDAARIRDDSRKIRANINMNELPPNSCLKIVLAFCNKPGTHT